MTLQGFALYGLAAPAVLTAVVLLLAWVSREAAEKAARGWLGALALGGAYMFGQAVAFGGLPPLPPVQATDRLFWLVAGAVLLAAAESLLAERRWPRRVLRGVYPFVVPAFLLWRLLERRELVEVALVVGLIGGRCSPAGAPSPPGRRVAPAPRSRWSCGGSPAGVPLRCCSRTRPSTPSSPASWRPAWAPPWSSPGCAPRSSWAPVRPACVAVLLACFWIAGVWLAATPLPIEAAVLLAVAPLLALAAEVGPLSRLAPAKAVLARLVLASLAVVPAVLLAWIEAPPPSPY